MSITNTDLQPETPYQPTTLPRPKLKRLSALRELFDLLILVGAIYALVNLATVRFIVQGPSMEPTFQEDQFLIISRANYLLGNPERGDVVVFHYPENPEEDYIKRVVGLPGDTVEIRDTLVYVNGEEYNEPYINEPCRPTSCPDEEWILAADEYFMMGDNRNRSSDSRDFGPVNEEFIVGEVMIRYWPPSDWGVVSRVNYPGN